MIHIVIAAPADPMRNRGRLPTLSMRKKHQARDAEHLRIPKMPVVNKPVFVPVMPSWRKTVGE
jgi:hypothetical protein